MCRELNKCLCCDKEDLKLILNLGDQPLANSYHKGEELPKYPLRVNLCTNCFHLQLSHAVSPDEMFKNYLYVSGTTQTLKDYSREFAKFAVSISDNPLLVCDVASNDATLLDCFKELGCKTYGVDPASNLCPIAREKGHFIINDYFTRESVGSLPVMDVITAQNVFAHTADPLSFLEAAKSLMHVDSVLLIQTSQANMVQNGEYDYKYHEHISHFRINSMKTLVERAGLKLTDVIKTTIHGTSYVFTIRKEGKPTFRMKEMEKREIEQGLLNIKTYIDFGINAFINVANLCAQINKFREQGYIIIGYGAAAKGNTLLNFGKIKLDYIIDDNPLKQGYLTPGMDIPIVPPAILGKEFEKILFIPLSWNFSTEITKRIKNLRDNPADKFLYYFPEIKVI